ncbi:MAG: hypothetical protein MI921_05040 [Cytophagales bacterium]|nr:hypothetical protein [Cytophagales bacterium]
MKRTQYLVGILVLVIIITFPGCDMDYSQSKMPKRPEIDENFYKLSIEAINQSIEKSPFNAEAYYKKARLLNNLKNYKSARINIEKAISLDQGNADYCFFLAENQFKNGEFKASLEAALKAESMGVDTPALNHLLANLYLRQRQLVKAIAYNSRALYADKSGLNYFQRGEILLADRDTTAAIRQFRTSLELDTTHGAAYDHLTKLYIAIKNADSAQLYLDKHRALDPANLKIWFDQGILYRLRKQDDSAKMIYRSIIREDSLAARSMVKMSELHFDNYRNDSATYYAEKALSIRENLKGAMLMQGKILGRRRYFGWARKKFEEILAIDSTYQPAKAALIQLGRRQNYFRRLERQREENQQIEILKPKKIKPE